MRYMLEVLQMQLSKLKSPEFFFGINPARGQFKVRRARDKRGHPRAGSFCTLCKGWCWFHQSTLDSWLGLLVTPSSTTGCWPSDLRRKGEVISALCLGLAGSLSEFCQAAVFQIPIYSVMYSFAINCLTFLELDMKFIEWKSESVRFCVEEEVGKM